jgi:hypothetical protein
MSWMRGFVGRSVFALPTPAAVVSGTEILAVVALVAVCSAGACLGIVGPTKAWAGEYHVYSCRMPNGEVAPTDGWSEESSGISASTQNTCATGGALVAGLGDGATHEVSTDHATWTFGAPSEMTITAARLSRAGDADGGWTTNATYEFWLAGPNNNEIEADVIDQCVAEFGCPTGVGNMSSVKSSSNVVTVLPENLDTHLYANASCGGSTKFICPSGKGDPNGYAAVVYLYAADLVLSQASQPTIANVEGELAIASTLSGTSDLAFHATDSGSGVYQAVFSVDGTEAGRTLLDSSSHCRDVGQTSDGLPAFLYLQPCAPALNADLQFDTTALSDGTHHLVVSVTDAASNSTVALDRKITVLNHPASPLPPETPTAIQPPSAGGGPTSTGQHEQPSPPSSAPQSPRDDGTAASVGATLQVHWAATALDSRVGAYGRAQTVTGRLASSAGAPIGDAPIQVLSTPSFQGARTRALMSVRTASNGSFRVRLPASTPSTHLTFAYSSHPPQAVPDVTAWLSLTVPAHLALRVAPHVSQVGGTIAFSGTLSGAPLPAGGKQLVLEARTLHGSWRQFRVLSTAAHGRFRATYRFRLPGPIDYRFRAVCAREADFPYGSGTSPLVRVHEK